MGQGSKSKGPKIQAGQGYEIKRPKMRDKMRTLYECAKVKFEPRAFR